jgi:hypothetical protein
MDNLAALNEIQGPGAGLQAGRAPASGGTKGGPSSSGPGPMGPNPWQTIMLAMALSPDAGNPFSGLPAAIQLSQQHAQQQSGIQAVMFALKQAGFPDDEATKIARGGPQVARMAIEARHKAMQQAADSEASRALPGILTGRAPPAAPAARANNTPPGEQSLMTLIANSVPPSFRPDTEAGAYSAWSNVPLPDGSMPQRREPQDSRTAQMTSPQPAGGSPSLTVTADSSVLSRLTPQQTQRIETLFRYSTHPRYSEPVRKKYAKLLDRELENTKLTTKQKEYVLALGQGFQGTFLDYDKALRRDPALEQKSAMLVRSGVPQNIADGLAAGRYDVNRHPINGTAQVVDKATGRIVFDGSDTSQADGAANVQPPANMFSKTPIGEQSGFVQGGRTAGAPSTRTPTSTMPADVDYRKATGTEGFFSSIGNTIAEMFFRRLPMPEAERASQALTNLQVRTQTALQDAVPGRPSNYLLQRLDKLAVAPGALTQGPERAGERLRQTRDMIRETVDRLDNEVLANPKNFTPQQIAQARLKRSEIAAVLRDYDAVVQAFEQRSPPQGGQRAAPKPGNYRWNPQTGRMEAR